MVDILRTPLEDLQQKVKAEIRTVLIDAAKKLNCHPEELRIRVVRNNLIGVGGYEVERISAVEMDKMHRLEKLKRLRKERIKKARIR